MNHAKRREDLSKRIENERIDSVAITTLPNLLYFFNYSGHSFERFCCGLFSKDGTKSALVIPKLDLGKTKRSDVGSVFAWTDTEGYENALKSAMSYIKAPGEKVGTELGLTLGQMEQFKQVLHTSVFAPMSKEISEQRSIKSQDELKSVRDSANRLARCYKAFPEIIKRGKTESDIGFEMVKIMSEKGLGGSELPLVQSGPNSAVPHSTASKRKLQNGDMIVVDASAPNSEGYFSDFTRTYIIGTPTERQKKVYEVVRVAQRAGIEASKLGATTQEIDRVARAVIEKAGYGEYFVHRTGHGLGLEVHEAPYLREGNTSKLEAGMVFTIEPGIYLPGKFGVRIEDNVLIDRNGSEDITKLSHSLIEV